MRLMVENPSRIPESVLQHKNSASRHCAQDRRELSGMLASRSGKMPVFLALNGRPISFERDSSEPLLWAIRELAGLAGTKYGCGIGQCGACTVHIDGKPARSC